MGTPFLPSYSRERGNLACAAACNVVNSGARRRPRAPARFRAQPRRGVSPLVLGLAPLERPAFRMALRRRPTGSTSGSARPGARPSDSCASCRKLSSALPMLVSERHRRRPFGAAHGLGKRAHRPHARTHRRRRPARVPRYVCAGQPRLLRTVRLPGDGGVHVAERDAPLGHDEATGTAGDAGQLTVHHLRSTKSTLILMRI